MKYHVVYQPHTTEKVQSLRSAFVEVNSALNTEKALMELKEKLFRVWWEKHDASSLASPLTDYLYDLDIISWTPMNGEITTRTEISMPYQKRD